MNSFEQKGLMHDVRSSWDISGSYEENRWEAGIWRKVKTGSDGALEPGARAQFVRILDLFL